MSASTLNSRGQVTIPKKVRERLGLKKGDRLIFRFDDLGNLLVRPEARSPLGRLPGLLHHLAGERPITVEEMNGAVKQRAQRAEARRSRPGP
jgi:antitoxin PrlF